MRVRDQKTIKEKSVVVYFHGDREHLHIIPEGIKFIKGEGWVLDAWNVVLKKETTLNFSSIAEWIPAWE